MKTRGSVLHRCSREVRRKRVEGGECIGPLRSHAPVLVQRLDSTPPAACDSAHENVRQRSSFIKTKYHLPPAFLCMPANAALHGVTLVERCSVIAI